MSLRGEASLILRGRQRLPYSGPGKKHFPPEGSPAKPQPLPCSAVRQVTDCTPNKKMLKIEGTNSPKSFRFNKSVKKRTRNELETEHTNVPKTCKKGPINSISRHSFAAPVARRVGHPLKGFDRASPPSGKAHTFLNPCIQLTHNGIILSGGRRP
jgi:hypothetical protein